LWIRCVKIQIKISYHSGETVSKTKPSIVGFVASMDNKCQNYYSKVIKNKPGEELSKSDGFLKAFKGALQQYKTINKIYPKNIIFYRDGVGEGQTKDLMKTEIKNVKLIF
jgi:aubergine